MGFQGMPAGVEIQDKGMSEGREFGGDLCCWLKMGPGSMKESAINALLQRQR